MFGVTNNPSFATTACSLEPAINIMLMPSIASRKYGTLLSKQVRPSESPD